MRKPKRKYRPPTGLPNRRNISQRKRLPAPTATRSTIEIFLHYLQYLQPSSSYLRKLNHTTHGAKHTACWKQEVGGAASPDRSKFIAGLIQSSTNGQAPPANLHKHRTNNATLRCGEQQQHKIMTWIITLPHLTFLPLKKCLTHLTWIKWWTESDNLSFQSWPKIIAGNSIIRSPKS